MHDGIVFEKLGLPAAPVCTEPFTPMGRASAAAGGIPDYPFVVIPHPLGRLTDDQIRERVERALPEVVALLLA